MRFFEVLMNFFRFYCIWCCIEERLWQGCLSETRLRSIFQCLPSIPPEASVGFSEAKALRTGIVDSHMRSVNVE